MTNLQESLSRTLPPLILSRMLIFLILALTPLYKVVIQYPEHTDITLNLNFTEIKHSLTKVLSQADAQWYVGLAQNGYDHLPSPSDQQQNWAMFPLLPILIHYLAPLLSPIIRDPRNMALLISNSSLLLLFPLLFTLYRKLGATTQTAERAIWILAFFPTSYFFSSGLTESTFMLLSVVSFLFVLQNKPILSGLVSALATACRPTGILLLPALAYLFFKKWQLNKAQSIDYLVGLFLAPLGTVIFMFYLWRITGDPLAFSNVQEHWGRVGSIVSLARYHLQNPTLVFNPWNFVWLNGAAALLALALGVNYYLRKNYLLAITLLIPTLFFLNTGNLLSGCRIVMVLFALPLGLSEWAHTPNRERSLLALCCVILAVMCVLYARALSPGMA